MMVSFWTHDKKVTQNTCTTQAVCAGVLFFSEMKLKFQKFHSRFWSWSLKNLYSKFDLLLINRARTREALSYPIPGE
jgi:hypothetical protein